MDGKLFIMIGVPGSGKSTFARDVLARTFEAEVVSSDGIRKELTGTEDFVEGDGARVFREFDRRLAGILASGRDAVADATNVHPRDWARLSQLTEVPYRKVAVWMDINPDEAMWRQERRERKVPREVVEKMWQCMRSNRAAMLSYFGDNVVEVNPDGGTIWTGDLV